MTDFRGIIGWQVDWVLVVASHCFQVVLSSIASGMFFSSLVEPFSLFWGKFQRAFRQKLVTFVQGKLSCISKLLCLAVYDWFSFFYFENFITILY